MTTNLGNESDHFSTEPPVLTIDRLQVTFATDGGGDVHAVRDVSLEVGAGEVVAIVGGESGSGKTVTAKTILGLLPETAISSGAVVINGNNVISVSKSTLRKIRGRDVAMVFQEPSTALNPVFTVGCRLPKVSGHTPRTAVASPPRKPSTGQPRRSARWASRILRRGSTTTRTSSQVVRSNAW